MMINFVNLYRLSKETSNYVFNKNCKLLKTLKKNKFFLFLFIHLIIFKI